MLVRELKKSTRPRTVPQQCLVSYKPYTHSQEKTMCSVVVDKINFGFEELCDNCMRTTRTKDETNNRNTRIICLCLRYTPL